MRPSEAADVIGITVAQVRQACRKGLIPATKQSDPYNQDGHVYHLEKKDVLWYKKHRPRPGPKKRSQQ